MIDADTRDKLQPLLRTAQIIVAALIGGCVFLCVMLVIVGNSKQAPDQAAADQPIIAYIGAGVAFAACIGRVVLGPIVGAASRQSPSVSIGNATVEFEDPAVGQAAKGWLVSHVVRGAMTEGAAIINAVAYFVHGEAWSLGVVGFLIAWMVIAFPRMSQLEDHIEQQKQQLEFS